MEEIITFTIMALLVLWIYFSAAAMDEGWGKEGPPPYCKDKGDKCRPIFVTKKDYWCERCKHEFDEEAAIRAGKNRWR